MKYLIIGASSGLGRELTKKFAEKGHNLIIASRDERDLNAIKSDLEKKFKINIDVMPLNFSSLDEIKDKLFSNQNLLQNLDGVLFPVGMMFDEDNFKTDSIKMNQLIRANFISIAFTIQELKKFFDVNKNPSIVGFGSVSGFLGRNINITYAAAKRALESYFESLCFEKDLKKMNIQFYILGYLDTNLSFGKNLKLPKAPVTKLARIVYKNLNKKFKKVYYPSYWRLVFLIIKIIPFVLLRKLNLK